MMYDMMQHDVMHYGISAIPRNGRTDATATPRAAQACLKRVPARRQTTAAPRFN